VLLKNNLTLTANPVNGSLVPYGQKRETARQSEKTGAKLMNAMAM
jgi:hypothetical protein